MRRRVWREVGTLLGIGVILTVIVLTNGAVGRNRLAERSIVWRESIEKERQQSGLDLLKWPLLQETSGGFRSGPDFDKELLTFDGAMVDIVGFQVPIEEFRNMSKFLILPMPIECYFCQSPPMKDVVLVQMEGEEKAPLLKEPVLIHGVLKLNKGPKQQFFYTIENAKWGPGKEGMKTHRREVPIEHQMPHNKPEQLLEGQEPPSPDVTSAPAAAAPSTEPAAQPAPAAPADAAAPAPAADGAVTPAPAEAAPTAPAPETAPAAPAPAG